MNTQENLETNIINYIKSRSFLKNCGSLSFESQNKDSDTFFPSGVISYLKDNLSDVALFIDIMDYNLKDLPKSFMLNNLIVDYLCLLDCKFNLENIIPDTPYSELKYLYIRNYKNTNPDTIKLKDLLSVFPNLEVLILQKINQVLFNEFTRSSPLYELGITGSVLPIYDLEKYRDSLSNIKYLEFENLICKEIPLSDTSITEKLTIRNSKIKSYKQLSKVKYLEYGVFENNNISKFNLEESPTLVSLSLKKNELENFRLINESVLERIDLSDNKIKVLEVKSCTNLKELVIKNCNLEKLVIRNCPFLYEIDVENNNLSDIDIDDGSPLIFFNGEQNKFNKEIKDKFPNMFIYHKDRIV